MSSLRMLKKDIDYLTEEALADCFLAIYFHPERKDEVVSLMSDTVDLRNELIHKANNPAEKKNKSLVRKHYSQLRRDMFTRIDDVFEKLSALNR